jgi:hypothetical protein
MSDRRDTAQAEAGQTSGADFDADQRNARQRRALIFCGSNDQRDARKFCNPGGMTCLGSDGKRYLCSYKMTEGSSSDVRYQGPSELARLNDWPTFGSFKR